VTRAHPWRDERVFLLRLEHVFEVHEFREVFAREPQGVESALLYVAVGEPGLRPRRRDAEQQAAARPRLVRDGCLAYEVMRYRDIVRTTESPSGMS
jgi:hypothetical protein